LIALLVAKAAHHFTNGHAFSQYLLNGNAREIGQGRCGAVLCHNVTHFYAYRQTHVNNQPCFIERGKCGAILVVGNSSRLMVVSARSMSSTPRILYCNCTYAQVVPAEVKAAVLKNLSDSGMAFEAVADLCEMSARRDPALKRLSQCGELKVAACFPRAVKWLFAAANAPLEINKVEVVNMRTLAASDVNAALASSELSPNLPAGKETAQPITS